MGSETESETESEAETEAKAPADTYTLRITESQNDGLQEQKANIRMKEHERRWTTHRRWTTRPRHGQKSNKKNIEKAHDRHKKKAHRRTKKQMRIIEIR